jgi:solute carrier family 25 (mitochondrial S-adenosylmethionine transporter), member 26
MHVGPDVTDEIVLFVLCVCVWQSPHGFYGSGGFRGVYNGMFAAAAGSAPGAALFFSTYETVKSSLTERVDPAYHTACYMASSACGEVTACWIRVPTENIKQKMQVGQYNNTTDCLNAIARSGRAGSGFYKGYTATVSREVPFSFIQFPIYETLKKQWAQWQGSDVTPIQSAVCGSIGAFQKKLKKPSGRKAGERCCPHTICRLRVYWSLAIY